MPAANFRVRPGRPVLQRGMGLARGLRAAMAPGWERGFDITNTQGSFEDQWGSRLQFESGKAPTATNYEHTETYGMPSIEDGSPAANFQSLIASGTLRYQVVGGLSAFFLVRPEDVGNDNCVTFKIRATPLGAANNGWDLRYVTANVWSVRICDGAAVNTCNGATSVSSGTGPRASTVVGFTWDGANINLYVNGKLDGTAACTLAFASVNNTQTPKWFGTGTAATDYADMTAGMGAVWSRPLVNSEIQSLYTDPFAMWRAPDDDIGNTDFQTYLNVF